VMAVRGHLGARNGHAAAGRLPGLAA